MSPPVVHGRPRGVAPTVDFRDHLLMVCGSTKMLLEKVSGNDTIDVTIMTDSGVRISRPIIVQIHDRLKANTSMIAHAATGTETEDEAHDVAYRCLLTLPTGLSRSIQCCDR